MPSLPSARAARATLDRSLRLNPFAQPARRSRKRRPRSSVGGTALRVLTLALLPAFFVRSATELYHAGFGTTTTMIGAGSVAVIVLALVMTALSRHLTHRATFGTVAKWVALPVVVLWTALSLLYLSPRNAKTAAVRSAYTSLHPVLRLAVSSAVVADGDLVVTDARRTAEDYRRMGLPVFERTMHYPQPDSWVHAVDVRTIGHGAVRNFMLTWYFRAVGLRVVRHVGTADHLHVELRR